MSVHPRFTEYGSLQRRYLVHFQEMLASVPHEYEPGISVVGPRYHVNTRTMSTRRDYDVDSPQRVKCCSPITRVTSSYAVGLCRCSRRKDSSLESIPTTSVTCRHIPVSLRFLILRATRSSDRPASSYYWLVIFLGYLVIAGAPAVRIT